MLEKKRAVTPTPTLAEIEKKDLQSVQQRARDNKRAKARARRIAKMTVSDQIQARAMAALRRRQRAEQAEAARRQEMLEAQGGDIRLVRLAVSLKW